MQLYLILIIVFVLFVTFAAILKRYRRCPSDKILVIYGKTGRKSSAKCIHGGAAFIWPVFQSYSYLDLTPISIECNLTNALSKQNIRVDVPCRFTVGISTESDSMTNAEVMGLCGRIPIPPYLKRETEEIDLTRYQTCYARQEGSVAAPTAGLHFTEREFAEIDGRGIDRRKLCLHVGAGTFLPVKSELIADHTMHSEPFEVSLAFLKSLRVACGGKLIAVGTTSTRCLESLYYLGVHCIERGAPGVVEQWEPYRDEGYRYPTAQALDALIDYVERGGTAKLLSRTQIIIVPGFRFRLVNNLVTNFHQPQSTLLLLIAAFVGLSARP